jgi:GTP-binding protein HflX
LAAASGEGCRTLLELIDDRLNADRSIVEVSLNFSDGEAIAWLYNRGEILERRDEESSAYFRVGMDSIDLARFEHRFPAIPTKFV